MRINKFWINVYKTRPDLQRIYPSVLSGDFAALDSSGNFLEWVEMYGKEEYPDWSLDKEKEDIEVPSPRIAISLFHTNYSLETKRPRKKKVLIATYLYSGSRLYFKKWIKKMVKIKMNGERLDHLLVDNSSTDSFYKEIKEIVGNDKKIKLYRMSFPGTTDSNFYRNNAKLSQVADFVRQYVITHDYSHVLIVESDVFPRSDIVKRLLSHDLLVVSAVVRYHDSSGLMAGRFLSNPSLIPLGPSYTYHVGHISGRNLTGLIQAHFGSLGCCLISREILEKITFRAYKELGFFHDTYFGVDCYREGISYWIDSSAETLHFKRSEDWKKWEEEVDRWYKKKEKH